MYIHDKQSEPFAILECCVIVTMIYLIKKARGY